jgi:CDP-diacylglycerol--serine O-phosphatidyltransferase
MMPRSKRQIAKDKLLRRMRRQRLKYITILPSLITILNGVCGFAAIVFAGRGMAGRVGNFSALAIAGYMILLAMFADMLDGRLARMSQSTSSFGGQLDSLCDIISFGVAPAFLMLKMLEYKLTGLVDVNPALVNFLRRFIWLAAATYVCCAAIRLARFNVENEQDESAHMSFIGLPSPAAAGAIVSLIIFHQDKLLEFTGQSSLAYAVCDNTIMYALPFVALGLAVLMVSRIRYPHVLNVYLRGKKPLAYFVWLLLAIGVIIWNLQAALVLIFCGFAISAFAKWSYYKTVRWLLPVRHEAHTAEAAE